MYHENINHPGSRYVYLVVNANQKRHPSKPYTLVQLRICIYLQQVGGLQGFSAKKTKGWNLKLLFFSQKKISSSNAQCSSSM